MEAQPKGASWNAGVWILIVLAIGIIVGAVLAWTIPLPPGPPGSAPPPPAFVGQLAVLLSVVCLVLLGALLAVYARSYRDTRAPYVLGLLVFLVALVFESALNSPLIFTAFGLGPGNLGRFLAASEFVLSAALSIFLYLSLQ